MARNEYYTYKDSPINGDIMMSVQVFDIITKQVAAEDKDIKLDTSKGFSVTGTKNLVNCTIKDNEVYITTIPNLSLKEDIAYTKCYETFVSDNNIFMQ